jgi:hypothetical protein
MNMFSFLLFPFLSPVAFVPILVLLYNLYGEANTFLLRIACQG